MKEIIIDGVDVAECNFRLERDGKQKCECCHATGFRVICDCEMWKNCPFKQLQRVKQENAELKADLKSLEYTVVLQGKRDIDNATDLFAKHIAKIESENSILKAKNAELKAENEIVRQAAKDFCKINEAYMKYEDCLKDIKAIAEDKIDCKQYEIDHDCFNNTRCKALKELIETLQEILDLVNRAEVGE